MAELPDLQVFSINLNKFIAGKKLIRIRVVNGKKLKDSTLKLSKALKGKLIQHIYRSGKELRFLFNDGTLLGMHLMLAGDIILFDKTNTHHSTIIEFYFADGSGLALTDRLKNANIKLDPIDKKGVDAISKELNYNYLKQALKRKKSIKSLLMDQDVIRGIGNSYSDEILWRTKINPYSIAEALPNEKIKELARVIKVILNTATKKISEAYPDKINVEVKDFLKIHSKKYTKSPTGKIIKINIKGMQKTYYTDEQILYK